MNEEISDTDIVAVCPRCKAEATVDTADEVFGYRTMKSTNKAGEVTETVRVQSYCRACRATVAKARRDGRPEVLAAREAREEAKAARAAARAEAKAEREAKKAARAEARAAAREAKRAAKAEAKAAKAQAAAAVTPDPEPEETPRTAFAEKLETCSNRALLRMGKAAEIHRYTRLTPTELGQKLMAAYDECDGEPAWA